MSMQVNRFESLSLDRTDKSNITIIDHKSDEKIIFIRSGKLDQADAQIVAAAVIDALEDLIINNIIKYD